METVFDVFTATPYELLAVERGGVYGNRITSETTGLTGVFKLKTGMNKSNSMENYDADATLHMRPEDAPNGDYMVLMGQGIRVNGITYSIEGVSVGKNFDNGTVEHIYLTLQKANFVGGDNGTDFN